MYACSSCVRVLLVTGLLATTPFTAARAAAAPSTRGPLPAQPAQVARHYAEIPLSFEANRNQSGANVGFLARGNGYQLDLTGDAAVLAVCRPGQGTAARHSQLSADRSRRSAACQAVRMQLEGTRQTVTPTGEEPLPGTVNYFIGNDPARWRRGIPTFARVRYKDAYPGIDLVYYGNQRQLEYDFVAAPGSDPRAIQLRFDSATKVRRSTAGDLLVSAPEGMFTFRKPAIYQIVDGRRVSIPGVFVPVGSHAVKFRLGQYDRSKTLVIDPVLVYSTFLGGSGVPNEALLGGGASAIAVDTDGNAYVTGSTISTGFPVTAGAFQASDPGAEYTSSTVFVSKLNAAGTELIYSTYLGGNGGDAVSSIAVDANGDAYVAGQTASQNFPVTPGAFQSTDKTTVGSNISAFVAELNPTGTDLIYSTYLGGSIWDGAAAIAVDAAGEAYVAGQTSSSDFPVTQGAFQTVNKSSSMLDSNAFIAKLNAGGTALVYSTFLGGSGGQRVVQGGCITGGESLLGWPLGNNEDSAFAIAIDAEGDAYVTGQALSTDFPVTQGAFQKTSNGAATAATNAFVAKLNPAGSALLYSTYLGGSGTACPSNMAVGYDGDAALALAVDSSGNAYVAGATASEDFPVTQGAFQTTNKFSVGVYHAGPTGFVAKLNPSGSALVYSTYLGGSGGFVNPTPFFAQYGGDQANGLAIDGNGDAFMTGATASADFPVTADAYQITNHYVVSTGACGNSCPGGAYGYNAFVTVLDPAGSALVYSTFLGGDGTNPNVESSERAIGTGDGSSALALDGAGNVYIAGTAESSTFPVTSGAYQTTIPAFTSAFIAKLDLGAVVSGLTGTATVLTASTTAAIGTNVTFTATVTPASGTAVPTGTVAFLDGITTMGSGSLNASGQAAYATTQLPPGANSITAVYGGDTNFTGSTSAAVTVTISAPPPDFSLSISPASGTETSSAPATSSITVTPVNGFDAAVTFACSGLPSYVTCSFNPATVTPAGAPVSTTVNFSPFRPPTPGHDLSGSSAPLTFSALGFGLWFLSRARKHRPLYWRVSIIALAMAFALGAIACGGSGSGGHSTQTSTVTITATSGAISHATTFSLTSTN